MPPITNQRNAAVNADATNVTVRNKLGFRPGILNKHFIRQTNKGAPMKLPAVAFTLVFAALTSSCMINHKRNGYSNFRRGTTRSIPIINDGYSIQIFGTDYSSGGGLTLDIRGPYSIHTRIWTKKPYTAYEITGMILKLEEHEKTIISRGNSIRADATLNPHGLYMASYDFDNCFNWIPKSKDAILELEVTGTIIKGASKIPFKVKTKFHYDDSHSIRMLSWDDLLSV